MPMASRRRAEDVGDNRMYSRRNRARLAARRRSYWNNAKIREARLLYYKRHRAEAVAYTRQWYRKNRAHCLQRERKYRQRHRTHSRTYQREWYVRHRGEVLARVTDYAQKHPRKVREYKRRWEGRNEAHKRASTARRRARLRGAPGAFTQRQWRELCARHDHRCALCGRRRRLSVDHIIPLSKSGSNFISNIQPLCLPCNLRKAGTVPGAKSIVARP